MTKLSRIAPEIPVVNLDAAIGYYDQKIEQKPWGNREFRVRDSSGNVLKFTEPLGEEQE